MRLVHKRPFQTLTKASSQFDQLAGLLDQLSPENRKLLAETFASIRPNLDQLLDKGTRYSWGRQRD